jgi:dihydrofolate synthase/folylpolyglutamate synthase
MRGPREYLASLERFGIRLGMERTTALLAELGEPQRALAAIHVVGTNGKSSTVRFCAAALAAQGLRTGAYLSPHVLGWEERVQLDGQPVEPWLLDAALARVEDAAGAVERRVGEEPTQFEALTAAAFLVLADAAPDVCVVEAGLGGRFDATNVLAARVVGLTSLGLDHTAVLGATREQILDEKLAVVHPGAVVRCGPLDDAIYARACALAGARGAASIERVAARDVPGLSGYQRANAALALALAAGWLEPVPLDERAASAALAAAAPVGRLELVHARPLELYDGAHNPDGTAALAAELDGLLGVARPRVAVCALQADKDAVALLAPLVPQLDRLVATDSGHAGSLGAQALAALAREAGLPAVAIDEPERALAEARTQAGADGAVVVCGSLYLLARLRDVAAVR